MTRAIGEFGMVDKNREDFEMAMLEGIYQILEILKLNIETLNGISDAIVKLAQAQGYEFSEDVKA